VLFYSWSAKAPGTWLLFSAHSCPGRTFFARSSIKDKIEIGFSSIAYGIFVPIFFINTGLSANVRQLPIDGLGLKMDMFFVREFPQLILIFIVLILVLVLWRLLIFYEIRVYNIHLGWRNDLLVLFLAFIAIAFSILSAIL
jgi:hypothetical protein